MTPSGSARPSSSRLFDKARRRLSRSASAWCRPCPDRWDCLALPIRTIQCRIFWRRVRRLLPVRSNRNFQARAPFVFELPRRSFQFAPLLSIAFKGEGTLSASDKKCQLRSEASVVFSLAQAFTPRLGEVTSILVPIYGLSLVLKQIMTKPPKGDP